jgi:hypothetical protein
MVREVVLLDGEQVSLELVGEGLRAALCYLGHLLRVQGQWISGGEINAAERQRRNEGLAGQRWDRVRSRLPEQIRSLIKSDRRKGYRLTPDAWRK